MADIEQTKHDLISSINNIQSMVDYLKNQVLPKVLNELDKDTEEKGEWIPIPYELDDQWDGQCPYCNEKVRDGQSYNFCPYCGHPMKTKG